MTSEGSVAALTEFASTDGAVTMPGSYYCFGYQFGARTADFFVLDSETLTKDDGEQLRWFDQEFLSSRADYKCVFLHRTLLSDGFHGDDQALNRILGPTVDGRAQLVASGHDHHLQLIRSTTNTLYMVCGAGAKLRDVQENQRSEFYASSRGFGVLELGASSMKVDFLDEQRRLLHSFEQERSKTRRRQGGQEGRLPWPGAAHSRFHASDSIP